VIDMILTQHEVIGITRNVGQIDMGCRPFAEAAKGIELRR
jgi:hypothetical protein